MPHRHAADLRPAALPLLAARAVLASAARDHASANALRIRSTGEHNRNQLRRSRRIGVASRLLEAASRDQVAEVRA